MTSSVEIPGLLHQRWQVDIWLPIPLNRPLSYVWEGDKQPLEGMRAVVPLKGKKLVTGIIWRILPFDGEKNLRPVTDLPDDQPFLSLLRMQFLEWMAGYYACTLGEVLLAAIPAPYRPGSSSYIHLRPDYDWLEEELNSEELWIYKLLKKRGKAPLAEIISGMLSGTAGLKLIRRWQEENRIVVLDEIAEKFPLRTAWFLQLAPAFHAPEALDALFLQLQDKPEEEHFLLSFLTKTGFGAATEENKEFQVARDLLKLNPEEKKILARFQRRGIIISERKRLETFQAQVDSLMPLPVLSPAQEAAFRQIKLGFQDQKPSLLMGVTGSGKTEIYMHLIAETLNKGRQVLMLLPEIGITIQVVNRLRQVFGAEMGVYHSRTGMPEKMEVWDGVERGEIRFVVGVRSAIFLPFSQLGLIIADEEHDTSFKQSEPAPRYHGRDAALFLARLSGADMLMGSATPAVESYYHARTGKWKLVHLTERFGNAVLPEIRFVDVRKAQRTLSMKLDFSQEVLDNLERIKAEGKQAIVFQNRRGYAPYMECADCGWIPYCPHCDVTLTYHQAKHSLNCHYCGYHCDSPVQCQDCGSVHLQTPGYGTEKLEESLLHLLPQLKVARMDQDTTGSRKAYEWLLSRMLHGEVDVLVGTQMVTKGLDFENVTLVSVFDVDRVLHYPEFRANERTFQLLSQISGRAGRREGRGLVLVQTSVPHHPLYRMVAQGETIDFYEQEVEHRRRYQYPPFSRMIRITSRNDDKDLAQMGIEVLARRLKNALGVEMVLGPEAPVIARLRGMFIFHLFLKIQPEYSPAGVKAILLAEIQLQQTQKEWKKVQWIVDVDPG